MLKLIKTSSDEGDVTLYNLEKITERQLKILQTGVDNIFQGMLRQNNYNSEDYELRREVEKLKTELNGSTTD
jgi:hypothetical protein